MGSALIVCPWRCRGRADEDKRPGAMGLAYFTDAIGGCKMPDADDRAAAPVSSKKDTVKQVHFFILQISAECVAAEVGNLD